MVERNITEHFSDCPSLGVVEGTTKAAKGTGAIGTKKTLELEGLSVCVIDQGQKFRFFALETGDDADTVELNAYLNDPETPLRILDRLKGDPDELKALLDTDELAAKARCLSPHPDAQRLAREMMTTQVEAAQTDDLILLDGRSMEQKALELQRRNLGRYLIGFYVTCDSSVAAQRLAGIRKPVSDMDETERARYLVALDHIMKRNEADATREIHPAIAPPNLTSVDITRFDIESVPEALMYGIDTTHSHDKSEIIFAMSSLVRRTLQRSAAA